MKNLELQTLNDVLSRLEEALKVDTKKNELSMDATIQRFEFSYELFWKTLKHSLLNKEGLSAQSPKQVFQEAFLLGWIKEEKMWLQMLQDRNLTSHTYQEDIAEKIYKRIKIYAKMLRLGYKELQKHV